MKENTSYIVHEPKSLVLTHTNADVCVCVFRTMKTSYDDVKLPHMVQNYSSIHRFNLWYIEKCLDKCCIV